MSTRRSQLANLGLTVAAATVGAAAGATIGTTVGAAADATMGTDAGAPAGPAVAGARAADDTIQLTARRTKITLPALPAAGVTYIATFDLFDQSGTKVGTAASGSSVVDVTTAGPVVLSSVVLKLNNGEIHYQRLMDRFGDYPRTATGAILGGTGTYRGIRGEVKITWPNADQINLVVQPAP